MALTRFHTVDQQLASVSAFAVTHRDVRLSHSIVERGISLPSTRRPSEKNKPIFAVLLAFRRIVFPALVAGKAKQRLGSHGFGEISPSLNLAYNLANRSVRGDSHRLQSVILLCICIFSS